MKYKWTMVGFLLGLALGRGRSAPLMLLGAMIGLGFDSGWFRRSTRESSDQQTADTQKNPFEVLEVNTNASEADIDAAYRRLIAQYHPDKVDGAAKEIRVLAQKRAAEINAAYDQIQKIRDKK
jgi:DnaJ-domain-containing protein 1